MGDLTENFSRREFTCHGKDCCDQTAVASARLVHALQRIRTHFGIPIHITRGFSCNKHNRHVGGVPDSWHTRGGAADCQYLHGISGDLIVEYCKRIPLIGIIILYDTHWHIDIRPRKMGRLHLIYHRTKQKGTS